MLPAVAGLAEPRLVSILVTAIAISLAVTPPVSNLGRKLAGRLRAGPGDTKLAGDNAPVLLIGLTPAGRAVADALAYNDIGYLALEPDHDRFQLALDDGTAAGGGGGDRQCGGVARAHADRAGAPARHRP